MDFDEEELRAIALEKAQTARWHEYGKSASFWALAVEKEASEEISACKAASASYRARRTWTEML